MAVSKSAVAVAVALLGLAGLVWMTTRPPTSSSPELTTGIPAPRPVLTDPAPATGAPSPSPSATVPLSGPARVSNRQELLAALTARGLDGERLLREYHAWRVANGFLGDDVLAGITGDDAPVASYQSMDDATLQRMAEANDLGALQTLAARKQASDPLSALDYYRRAMNQGSLAAVMGYSDTLKSIGPAPGSPATDKDPRTDVLAMGLAAVRSGGPAVAEAGQMIWLTATARQMNREQVVAACARSLAILAEMSVAQTSRGNEAGSPPIFVTEKNVYQQLPCGDTPAPITPPKSAQGCEVAATSDAIGRPVELWVCAGT